MRLCYNGLTTKYATLQQEVVAASKAGFGYMEMRDNKIEDYLEVHTMEDLQAFLAKWNIKVATINSIEITQEHTKEDHRKKLMAKATWMLQVAKSLGADSLIIAPLFNDQNWSDEQIDTFLVEVYRELSQLARPYGVRIAFEIIAWTEAMVPNLERAMSIIEKIDCDNVGLCFDCFAFYGNWSTLDMITKIPPQSFFMLHLNDARIGTDRVGIREKDRCFPGEGEIDLVSILSKIKDVGYDGACSLELINPHIWEWDTEEAVQHGYRTSFAVVSQVYQDVI